MTVTTAPSSHPPAGAAPAGATGVVAYVAGTFPLRSETFIYREVRGLRRRGWDVVAVSLNDAPADAGQGFDDLERGRVVVYGAGRGASVAAAAAEMLSHPLRSLLTLTTAVADAVSPGEAMSIGSRAKLPGQALFALGLARRLRGRGVRHVHAHFAHAPATVGMYAAKQLGVPFSFTGHANDLFQRRSMLGRKLGRARFVNCISRWHREFYEAIAPGAGGTKYRIVRCGVDVAAFSTGGRRRPDSSGLRVLTLCRLVEKKGVDTLLRAVAGLRGRGIAAQLTIAGDGPDRARLSALAEALKIADAITWLGAVQNERVPELLAGADVFALPCRADANGDKDGIPVVLMEAMACGVPAVAGDLPAIRELVEEGVSGLRVDGNDAEALEDRLAMLAGDAALCEKLSRGGRARVESEFSLEMNLDRLEANLREALHPDGAARKGR